MKVHRFYIGERWGREVQHFGDQKCWVQDKELTHQWHKVLRLRVGEELSLFDDYAEMLYRISEVKADETALIKVTEVKPKKSSKHVLLAWSLLKKDKNDWVLQKATEIGVTHFAPILSERSEKTGFNIERATKIIIEAAEQCGRIDIPVIDDVRDLKSLINTFKDSYNLYACDERAEIVNLNNEDKAGIIIGPEGGWSDAELEYMKSAGVNSLVLGNLTLRAETAAVVAATKILGINV